MLELADQGAVVGGDQHRRAEVVHLLEDPDQRQGSFVAIAGGFVGNQELGPPHDGAGDGHSPPLASGQRRRGCITPPRHPDPGQ